MKMNIQVEYIIKDEELLILEELNLKTPEAILEFFNSQLDMSTLDPSLTKGVGVSIEI